MGGSIFKILNSHDFTREIMARNYKFQTQHIKETTNSTGGWIRIASFRKDTPNSSGKGYLDRCTINYLVDDIDGADTLRASFPFGMMFALSNAASLQTVDGEANMLGPEHMLDVGCRSGGGGSITLSARRSIAENVTDTSEGDGIIHLWVKNTDLTTDDNIIMRYYLESYGRWLEVVDA